MIKISKRYDFDSAHQLHLDECTVDENEDMFGKCNNLHGHTYSLIVTVSGNVDKKTGMIMNYFDLDKIVKPLVADLDHKFLNDVFPGMLTTSENMVLQIANWIRTSLPSNVWLAEVTISETPKTTATWHP